MLERNFREQYVSEETVKIERQRFVSELAQTMGWDANNLTESQMEHIQRQPGWRAAGMIKS